ncbi:hypothetical protein FACS1894202_04010 [Clostridia bacterium]|nr:hypothetical protein FACS1894202_04010 [Clostridia bacterium]
MKRTKTNQTALRRLFPLFALMLVMGAFFVAGTTAYATDEPPNAETMLTVKEVWLTGDTLHVSVIDGAGDGQTLELNLREYAKPTDEYVTVQATDSGGKTSNSVTFKNPYYVAATEQSENENIENTGAESPADTSESSVSAGKPFTPDGAGSTIDNATSGDGKEFFTVETPDGNVFYLIVDRQRNSENVYLLNAVTEDDLASLAKPGDGKSDSAIPAATEVPPATTTTPEPTPESTPTPAPEKSSSGNTGLIAFLAIAAVVVIGAGYYFKVVRPKKSGADTDYDSSDDFDEDDEHEIPDDDDDSEDGDDE